MKINFLFNLHTTSSHSSETAAYPRHSQRTNKRMQDWLGLGIADYWAIVCFLCTLTILWQSDEGGNVKQEFLLVWPGVRVVTVVAAVQ